MAEFNTLFDARTALRAKTLLHSGSSDSTAVIQAAIDELDAMDNPAELVFGPGVWDISDTLLTAEDSLVAFRGQSGAVIRAKAGSSWSAGQPMIEIRSENGGFGSRFGAVTDLIIDGNDLAPRGIKAQTVQRVFFNITINRCTQVGFHVYGSQNCSYHALSCEDNGTTGTYDANLWLDWGARNNWFYGTQLSALGGTPEDRGRWNLAILQTEAGSVSTPGGGTGPSDNRFFGYQFERVAQDWSGAVVQTAGFNNRFYGGNTSTAGDAPHFTVNDDQVGNTTNSASILMFIEGNTFSGGDTGVVVDSTYGGVGCTVKDCFWENVTTRFVQSSTAEIRHSDINQATNSVELASGTTEFTPNLYTSTFQRAVIGNGNSAGITINAPPSAYTTQRFTLQVYNSSGGAMGTLTFASGAGAYWLFSGTTSAGPANGAHSNFDFIYDGTHWRQQ